MKKITFILFVLIAGTTFAQDNTATSTASADIFAEIVSPISIAPINALDFGRLIGNSAGGIVTIAATEAGTRTSDNNDLLAATGATPMAARFNIKASEEYTYKITLASTGTLVSGSATPMPIAFSTNLEETANAGNGSTPIALYVGGDLTLGINQAEGEYTGEVSVTVTYE